MADPDFELRRGPGSILLTQPAFHPSAISSFSPKTREGEGRGGGSPRFATAIAIAIAAIVYFVFLKN